MQRVYNAEIAKRKQIAEGVVGETAFRLAVAFGARPSPSGGHP